MYKEISIEQYKQYLGLDANYSVTHFVSFGGWDVDKYFMEMEKCLKERGVSYTARRFENFLRNIIEIQIGDSITWYAVCYGSAMLSEYAHLACLLGAQSCVHWGSCGGLSRDIQTLDVLIPDEAYADESSVRMYSGENNLSSKSDQKLSRHFTDKLQENNIPTKGGKVISIQAMMAETSEDVAKWSREGYVGVDMETATLFAVCNHFNVPVASLMFVSDNMAFEETVLAVSYEKQKEKRSLVKKAIYDVVVGHIVG